MLVVPQLAIVHEQHNARSCELLGEGCKPEVRLRIDGTQRTQVGNSIALPENRLAVADNEHSRPGRVGRLERGEDLLDLAGVHLSLGAKSQPQEKAERDTNDDGETPRRVNHARQHTPVRRGYSLSGLAPGTRFFKN